MQLKPFLCCFLLLAFPLVGLSNANAEFIEYHEKGTINWSRGVITAEGFSEPSTDDVEASQPELAWQAYQQASDKILCLLKFVRIDALTRVCDRFAADPNILEQVKRMADVAAVLEQEHRPDGKVVVTLQFRLRGGFSQLLLPSEIRQVEPIKPMSVPHSANETSAGARDEAVGHLDAYTGLVIDVRGINVRPAMVPLIVDEKGQELYSPAFISREYAVQYGVCEYICDIQDSLLQPRVGSRALILKALRARSPDGCDLVVSNKDASRLRDVCENLDFLRRCRVVFVVDCVEGVQP